MKLRSADLDTRTLVDEISAKMLDHLIACRICSAIFAAQQHSLGETECVEGKQIASESAGRRQHRNPNLVTRHVSEESLEDYIFERLAFDEQRALDYHLGCCSQCAKTAKEQEILASWLRAAFYPREHDVNTSSIPAMFLPIGHYASALPVCG